MHGQVAPSHFTPRSLYSYDQKTELTAEQKNENDGKLSKNQFFLWHPTGLNGGLRMPSLRKAVGILEVVLHRYFDAP